MEQPAVSHPYLDGQVTLQSGEHTVRETPKEETAAEKVLLGLPQLLLRFLRREPCSETHRAKRKDLLEGNCRPYISDPTPKSHALLLIHTVQGKRFFPLSACLSLRRRATPWPPPSSLLLGRGAGSITPQPRLSLSPSPPLWNTPAPEIEAFAELRVAPCRVQSFLWLTVAHDSGDKHFSWCWWLHRLI